MIALLPTNLHWIDSVNEAADLCAHSGVDFRIGDSILVSGGDWTVSAAALYLLRTSRRVVNCRTIARLPADRSLILAEFAREDKNALASVVLIDRERMIFADYHAMYRGEGEDLWRIGDSGALDVDGFRVVFLLQRGSFYALGVAWAGEEGLNLSVFVSNGDDHFDKVIADYWYREPV